MLDPLVGHIAGKSVLAIWERRSAEGFPASAQEQVAENK
jgi:hypothetical protein